MTMTDIQRVLEAVRRLPPLSASASRLVAMSGHTEVAAEEVAAILLNDPVLAAHVLRVANSAAFARAEPVTSVSMAVAGLGNLAVFGIALGYCLSGVFGRPLPGYECGQGELWRESLCGALAARLLAPHAARPVHAETAYTAGLLHDIGKVVLSEFLEGHTRELVAGVATGSQADFLAAETRLAGLNHSEAGLAMARAWGLPEVLAEAIAHHHDPARASEPHRALVYVVHAADALSMMVGAQAGADAMLYRLDPRLEEFLPLGQGRVEDILCRTQTEWSRLEAALAGARPASGGKKP